MSNQIQHTYDTVITWYHVRDGLPEKNITVLAAKMTDPISMHFFWNHKDTNWSSGIMYRSFQEYPYWAYRPFPIFTGK